MNPEPEAPAAAHPVLGMVVGNALALAACYLAVGVVVETVRRVYPAKSVLTLSFALDALPARVLGLLGLLEPLREAYLDGRLSEAGLRVVFGLTALGVIFLLASLLGLVAASMRATIRR